MPVRKTLLPGGRERTGESSFSSTVRNRTVVVGGKRTGVSLEDDYWNALREIAEARNIGVRALASHVIGKAPARSRSSVLRVFVIEYFRLAGRS